MRYLLKTTTVLFALIVGGCAAPKEQLSKALQNADRIVVSSIKDEGGGVEQVCELRDPHHVQSFLSQLSFKQKMQPWCKCLGDVFFDFYEQDRHLAKLSLHHESRLRWNNGKWSGQAELTPEAQSKLRAWLSLHKTSGRPL